MIRTENIRRRFRDLQVLKGINLEIGKGEVISIVGASGAGKTTLLQILGTLDKQDEGVLYFKDEPIGEENSMALIHAKWHQRFITWLIDRLILISIQFSICFALWGALLPEDLIEEHWIYAFLLHYGFQSGLLFVYTFLFEALTSKTIGKMIMRTRVIDRYGKKATTGAILGRSLARLIPFEEASFLSKVPQNGLHDAVANTIVISDTERNPDGNYSYAQLGEDGLARFRNEELGFVFQFHHLLPEFNALENVALPGYVNNNNTKEVNMRAQELLTYLGLGDRLHHKPNELSGGEQQRVAVARALINSPAIILADEPSGNLDSESAKSLHQLFFDLRDRYNQTFIIVTHNEELANMADRKLVMKDGIILTENGQNVSAEPVA